MCLAYPGTVLKIKGNSAVVSYPSGDKKVLVGDDDVKVGDIVLVQMGVIIKVLNEEESINVCSAWDSLNPQLDV